MLPPVIISPPFGHYISLPRTISVAGSYTAEPRKGLVRNTIKSLRPIQGGWVNRIGLRNPGIRNIKFRSDKIYSVAPLIEPDFEVFLETIPAQCMVELNLGCPNVDGHAPYHQLMSDVVKEFVKKFELVIMKLSPQPQGKTHLGLGYRDGVRYFHLSNTIPTERGGESGDRLRWQSLKNIRWTRQNMPEDIVIIGGGGVYKPEHVREYRAVGANHISISTAFFKPWTVPSIISAAAD